MTAIAAVETDNPGRWNAAAEFPDGSRHECHHRHSSVVAALACARFMQDGYLHPDAECCPHVWAAPGPVGRLEAHRCHLSTAHDVPHLCSCGLEEVTG
jgi:hypothetical protein